MAGVNSSHISFTTFALIIFVTLSSCANINYVTPHPNTSCPAQPCLTLSQYVQQTKYYFTSNTTFVFLDGEHELSAHLALSSISNITLTGNTSSLPQVSSEIKCTRPVNIEFDAVSKVKIAALAFASCGMNTSINGAIYLTDAQNISLSDCILHDNIFTALTANHSSLTLNNITFANNSQSALKIYNSIVNSIHISTFTNNSGDQGGAAAIYNSVVNFTGTTVFESNSAKDSGGSLYLQHTTVSFTGVNLFRDSHASGRRYWSEIEVRCIPSGGGVLYAASVHLVFEGETSFVSSSGEHGGGILAIDHTTMNFNGNYTFINNSALFGGGIAALSDTTMNFSGNCSFINNSARFGGGGAFSRADMTFNGNYSFINNSGSEGGGGICAMFDTTMNFSGDYSFINNSAFWGGGVFARDDTTMNFNGNYSFISNSAFTDGGGVFARNDTTMNFNGNYSFISNSVFFRGGGISAWFNTTMNFNANYIFINNSAVWGGGISAHDDTTMNFNGNYSFINNLAGNGGGIKAHVDTTMNFNGNCSFINNSAIYNGGGIAALSDTTMNFSGNYSFINNSASYGGAIEAWNDTTMNFSGNYYFINNSAILGGGILAWYDTTMSFNENCSFINNSATYSGGGIMAETTTINLYGVCAFTNNSATYGGGIALTASVYYLFPEQGSTMYFAGNYAQRGGAIYVFDSLYNLIQYCSAQVSIVSKTCFLQIHSFSATHLTFLTNNSDLDVSVIFEANSALEAGDDIYGGTIDTMLCVWAPKYIYMGHTTGDLIDILAPGLTEDKISAISSYPVKVCICNTSTGHPDCDRKINVTSYPGESFTVTLVAVGQRDGTVPSVIHSIFEIGSSASLKSGEKLQSSNKICTPLHYTVFSDLCSDEIVNLYVEGLCGPDFGKPLSIPVKLQPCPHGFELSPTTRACVCEKRLQTYTDTCDINRQTISRDGHSDFWVGHDNETGGLILHPHCPFNYCKSEPVNFTLNDTDLQCNYNRSGLLCGNCQASLSLTLGTSRCLECSDTYLTLFVAFALAGLFLVFFLLIFRITVAVGTFSGLIFYANIVAVNQFIFFPQDPNPYGRFLSVFIAWLNLDLGIETCFYDGMDAYAKTWLQFVFPIYIWVLVGLMIISSYYSTTVARTLHGTNPVAVLATLFLLSYTKILRTIIAALAFTNLQYPSDTQTVWLYDGNITYLSGRHIPLFIAALTVFLVLFLPYTLLLLTGQFLQANSNHRVVAWLYSRRFKPLMDAYHGPYRDKHRYWPGLLLVIRVILLLTFSSNVLHDPSVNLLATSTCTTGLLTLVWLIRGVYKKWYLEVLEAFFILNLGILAVGTYHVKLSGGSQAVVAYTSVSSAFVVFIGIVAYHMFLQLRDMLRRRQRRRPMALLDVNEVAEDTPDFQVPSQVELERVVSDETRALVPTTVVVVPKQECERETLIFDTD